MDMARSLACRAGRSGLGRRLPLALPQQPAPARHRPLGRRRRTGRLGSPRRGAHRARAALCVAVTLYAVHVLVARVAGRGSALVAQLVDPRPRRHEPVAGRALHRLLRDAFRRRWSGPRRPGPGAGTAHGCGSSSGSPRSPSVRSPMQSRQHRSSSSSRRSLTAVVAIFDQDLAPRGRAGVSRRAPPRPSPSSRSGVGLRRPRPRRPGPTRRASTRPSRPRSSGGWRSAADEQRAAHGVVNYGTYSREMVDAVGGRSPEEMEAYAAQVLADRWAERGLGRHARVLRQQGGLELG